MVFRRTPKHRTLDEVAIVYTRAVRNVSQMQDKILRSYGLKTPEWLVLSYADSHNDGQGVKVGDIAQTLDVQSTYITSTLRTLTDKGLISVDIHPDDRRARCVTASKQGAVVIKAVGEELAATYDRLLRNVSDGEMKAYIHVLQELADRH